MLKKLLFIFSATLLLLSFCSCAFAQKLLDVDRSQVAQSITNFIFALQRNDIAETQGFFDTKNSVLLSEVHEALSKITILSYDIAEQNISLVGQGQVKVTGKVVARGEEAGVNWQISGLSVYFIFNKIGEKWLITDTDFYKSIGSAAMDPILKKILPFIFIFGIITILLQVFWLLMLFNCLKRDFDGKNKWLVILFFSNFIGAFFYYFLIKRKNVQQTFHTAALGQAQIDGGQQSSLPTIKANKSFYSFLKVFLVCSLIFAVIFVIVIYFIFHQAFSAMSGFANFMDKFSRIENQNLPKSRLIENTTTTDLQNSVDKNFAGYVYRNEIYGFEIKCPEQWSLKDTLPKIKKYNVGTENIECSNNPFPTTLTRFVLYADPMGFGTEYCTVNYEVNSDGFKILSVSKGEDQCSPEYQNSHLKPLAMEKCSDGLRYACFSLPTMNNDNFYWGYLMFDTTGNHPTSESEADILLQKMLFSFKAF